MAVTYLTKTELGHFLQHNGNIEASVRSALIDSLEQSGVFKDADNSTRGWFEVWAVSRRGGPAGHPDFGRVSLDDRRDESESEGDHPG